MEMGLKQLKLNNILEGYDQLIKREDTVDQLVEANAALGWLSS